MIGFLKSSQKIQTDISFSMAIIEKYGRANGAYFRGMSLTFLNSNELENEGVERDTLTVLMQLMMSYNYNRLFESMSMYQKHYSHTLLHVINQSLMALKLEGKSTYHDLKRIFNLSQQEIKQDLRQELHVFFESTLQEIRRPEVRSLTLEQNNKIKDLLVIKDQLVPSESLQVNWQALVTYIENRDLSVKNEMISSVLSKSSRQDLLSIFEGDLVKTILSEWVNHQTLKTLKMKSDMAVTFKSEEGDLTLSSIVNKYKADHTVRRALLTHIKSLSQEENLEILQTLNAHKEVFLTEESINHLMKQVVMKTTSNDIFKNMTFINALIDSVNQEIDKSLIQNVKVVHDFNETLLKTSINELKVLQERHDSKVLFSKEGKEYVVNESVLREQSQTFLKEVIQKETFKKTLYDLSKETLLKRESTHSNERRISLINAVKALDHHYIENWLETHFDKTVTSLFEKETSWSLASYVERVLESFMDSIEMQTTFESKPQVLNTFKREMTTLLKVTLEEMDQSVFKRQDITEISQENSVANRNITEDILNTYLTSLKAIASSKIVNQMKVYEKKTLENWLTNNNDTVEAVFRNVTQNFLEMSLVSSKSFTSQGSLNVFEWLKSYKDEIVKEINTVSSDFSKQLIRSVHEKSIVEKEDYYIFGHWFKDHRERVLDHKEKNYYQTHSSASLQEIEKSIVLEVMTSFHKSKDYQTFVLNKAMYMDKKFVEKTNYLDQALHLIKNDVSYENFDEATYSQLNRTILDQSQIKQNINDLKVSNVAETVIHKKETFKGNLEGDTINSSVTHANSSDETTYNQLNSDMVHQNQVNQTTNESTISNRAETVIHQKLDLKEETIHNIVSKVKASDEIMHLKKAYDRTSISYQDRYSILLPRLERDTRSTTQTFKETISHSNLTLRRDFNERESIESIENQVVDLLSEKLQVNSIQSVSFEKVNKSIFKEHIENKIGPGTLFRRTLLSKNLKTAINTSVLNWMTVSQSDVRTSESTFSNVQRTFDENNVYESNELNQSQVFNTATLNMLKTSNTWHHSLKRASLQIKSTSNDSVFNRMTNRNETFLNKIMAKSDETHEGDVQVTFSGGPLKNFHTLRVVQKDQKEKKIEVEPTINRAISANNKEVVKVLEVQKKEIDTLKSEIKKQNLLVEKMDKRIEKQAVFNSKEFHKKITREVLEDVKYQIRVAKKRYGLD